MEWVILRQDTTKYCKFFAKCQTLADAIKDSTSGGTQNTTRAKGMTSTIVASHQRPLCILSLSLVCLSLALDSTRTCLPPANHCRLDNNLRHATQVPVNHVTQLPGVGNLLYGWNR
jgi:hypothetical protein